jgi:membrane fusion protein, heavy metal efflux system
MFKNEVISVIIVCTLAVLSCNKKEAQELKKPDEESGPVTLSLSPQQASKAGIKTERVERRPMARYLECNGKIEVPPQHIISIHSPSKGFIVAIMPVIGQFVTKGTTLLVIKHPDIIQLQEAYLSIGSQLKYLEKEYLRQKRLAAEEAVAQKIYEKVEADFHSLKSQYTTTAAQLELLGINPKNITETQIVNSISIYAPASGYVVEINTNTGQFVNIEMPLLKLINTEHIHAELQVFGHEVNQVKLGMPVELIMENAYADTLKGSIEYIGQTIDLKTQTVAVHAHLIQAGVAFKTGLFVKAKIRLSVDTLVAIPKSAVIQEGKSSFVYVQIGDFSYEKCEIEPLRSYHEWLAIRPNTKIERKAVVITGIPELEVQNRSANNKQDAGQGHGHAH